MNTTFKALTIAATCTLPIAKSHAWPVLTPEQLKAALEAIRKESTTRSDFPFKIEEIKYASDGIPESIKGIGITSEYLNATLTQHIEPFSLNVKDREDFGKTGERLEALSEELSVEDLKKRGVDINHLKTLGIENVREITFASILKSRFFTTEQRKKAKVWFREKETLEKAIEDYANNYPYDLLCFERTLYYKTNDDEIDEHTIFTSCIIPKGEEVTPQAGWWLRWGDNLRYKIASSLKNMLLYKNGKEKVILLLLLDEATPKEHRCKWGYDKDARDGGFQRNNVIIVDMGGEWWSLSHEIGHYLQMHFGLVQTFENYQTEFAKQLLLLNNIYPKKPMSIPSTMREYASLVAGSLFWHFDRDYFACPEQLPLNEIFAYVQLLIRWQSTAEISNILGVYFNGNTLYLNALSDIRELKRIRYTHNTKSWGDKIFKYRGALPKETQTLLQDIFDNASRMSLPKDMLELLCRLHQRKKPGEDADNVVCDFDCKYNKEWSEHITAISDLIEAE